MQGTECYLITLTEHSDIVPLTYYLFRNIIAHFKMSYLGILQYTFIWQTVLLQKENKKWIQSNVRQFILLRNLTEKKSEF